MSDLFDDDSISKIQRMTPIMPIVQDDELFPEQSKEENLSYFDRKTSHTSTISEIEGKKESIEIKVKTTKEESTINIVQIKEELNNLKKKIDNILQLLDGKNETNVPLPPTPPIVQKPLVVDSVLNISTDEDTNDKILEGVFNGEKMLGSDGKEYSVPPNYASKSKLVEGDIMKLTFAPNGRFIYKQIGPISRKRIIGLLQFDEERQLWNVHHEGKKYKVLTASVTFYKGKPNDEAVVLIPQENNCGWCAMENIISK